MKIRDLMEGRSAGRGPSVDSAGFSVKRWKTGGEVSDDDGAHVASVSALPVEGGGRVYLVHDIDKHVDLYGISQGGTTTRVFKSEDKAYDYAKALVMRLSGRSR